MTDLRLNGKTAIVTGAASGIGRAIALCFAAHDATVRLVDLDEGAARATAAEIVRSGGNATGHVCDVANAAQVSEVFGALQRQSLPNILVNSAGVAHVGNLLNTSDKDFDRLFRINVLGTHHALRAVIEPMVKNGGGVILNMASIAASAGLEDRYAYSMSKGAVLAMTYSVARDYLHSGVRCNAISPARVHTPFVDGFVARNYPGHEAEAMARLSQAQPIGRMAQPDEVAKLALYLCSDEASFITGTDYPLDGGFMRLRG